MVKGKSGHISSKGCNTHAYTIWAHLGNMYLPTWFKWYLDEKNPMPNEVKSNRRQSHMRSCEVHHGERCGEAVGEVLPQKCWVMKEIKLCKNGLSKFAYWGVSQEGTDNMFLLPTLSKISLHNKSPAWKAVATACSFFCC